MHRLAVIGLGTMGAPMVKNLRQKGFDVAAMDLSEGARAAVDGAIAPAPEALSSAEAIITMLPEGRHVASVFERVILPGAPAGALLVDCSTIDVATAKTLAMAAEASGRSMLDAPVSGGPEAASTGALSLMVGGPDAAYARAAPLLDAIGAKRRHFGAAGSGQAAKACHNMIVGVTAMGVMEGFALADRLGLDLHEFYALCAGAAAQSWTLENRCPVPGVANTPASNGYAPGFAAALMAKDLRLAQAAAEASGQETPFGAKAAHDFTAFAEGDAGAKDFSAYYTTLKAAKD
ncbi:MAG: NAD(P)-binding domain-containing protein [Pseudomonadota bacterium]